MIRSEFRSALRRCPTEEEAGSGAPPQPVGQLQSLIAQRMQRAQELLEEMRLQVRLNPPIGCLCDTSVLPNNALSCCCLQELQKAKAERERGGSSSYLKGIESPRLHHLRGSDSPHSRLIQSDALYVYNETSLRRLDKSFQNDSSDWTLCENLCFSWTFVLGRSSGSPRSRSSDSPRLRGKDSPRLRGRESPRSKAKRNRSKGTDSPRSRGSHSPAAKASDSPQLKDSPHLSCSPRSKSSDAARSPKLKGSSAASSNKQEDSPAQKILETPPGPKGSSSSQVKGSESPQDCKTDSPLQGSVKESHRSQNSPNESGSSDSSQPKSPNKHPPATQPSEEDLGVERRRAEAERLLEEAVSSWKEAQEVLQEVKELQSQTLRRQRRRTYEKMRTSATTALLSTATAAAEEDDTPASPTSPEDEDESETP